MAFPDNIETGANATELDRLGIAGPNLSDNHGDVHSASGMAALLIALQQAIGIYSGVQSSTLSWSPIAPTTQSCRWTRVGNLVTFEVYASWATATPGTTFTFTAPTEWGLGSAQAFATGYKIKDGTAYPLMVRIASTSQVFRWSQDTWVTQAGSDAAVFHFSGSIVAAG